MTDHSPRLFHSDDEIDRLGEGLVERTLPRADWTHEAHLAATTWLLTRRPDIDLDARLPDIIRRYNESVGGVNDDTQGYHDTITRTYLHGVRLFVREKGTVPEGTVPGHSEGTVPGHSLHELVNDLLLSPIGRRDWPLRFYSAERLFSVEARRSFIAPDLATLP